VKEEEFAKSGVNESEKEREKKISYSVADKGEESSVAR